MSREDIFTATYALLHAPTYRAKFAENLKRELPRLPLDAPPLDSAQWRQLVEIGRKLGDLHVGYENAPVHPFQRVNTTPKGVPFDFRVQKMKFNADKTTLRVNSSTELRGFGRSRGARLGSSFVRVWSAIPIAATTNASFPTWSGAWLLLPSRHRGWWVSWGNCLRTKI